MGYVGDIRPIGVLNFLSSDANWSIFFPPDFCTLASDVDPYASNIVTYIQSYANSQPSGTFTAGITFYSQSDIFCSEAIIINGPHTVNVEFIGTDVQFNDTQNKFFLSIAGGQSDNISLTYSDAFCGTISKTTYNNHVTFTHETSDANFLWVDISESDSLAVSTNIFNNALLEFNAEGTLSQINIINPALSNQNPMSDPDQVNTLIRTARNIASYLEENFPSDYPNNISAPVVAQYQGPISARTLDIDLLNGTLIFSNFSSNTNLP